MDKSTILRTSLKLLYYSGTWRALRGLCGGIGAIFMLHHVRPGGGLQTGFAPNRGLEITPEFLDAAIRHLKQRGYSLLSVTEALARLAKGAPAGPPFAAFTLDDGYRDNLVHAWPVFRRHGCPFTIFVAPAIADGVCELWWRGLELAIAGARRIEVEIDGEPVTLDTGSARQKQMAFERLYWPLRAMEQSAQRRWIRRFCESQRIDLDAFCREAGLDWPSLRRIAADPLCAIGAHTINHFALAKLAPDQARAEMIDSRTRIAAELGAEPTVFAYPYGDAASAGPREFALAAEAGFAGSVTTRKGLIFAAHRASPQALPRVSLNGGFQDLRYLDVLISGTAFAVWNGFKRVQTA